ncbi:hypothetical protein [uncultured Senegalimassilia sp.]|uniref:hypothetical protein n=1 Tax=uncultured Senegalimassilia sp. TaxID=1714350 RepID=UPI0025CD43AE|nr:hypothetical protein [uncultured Senegalimassilia sp.]
MLDIRYESSAGVSVALNSGVYVGRPNDLFSREWDYKLGYRALATASRGARKVSFKAFFADMAQADAFRRCADSDMQKGMPGTLRVEGWFQRCFVVASEVDGIGGDFFAAKLTLVLLDGVWRRGTTTAFVPVQSSADYEFLDLPYDLPYDLGAPQPRRYAVNPGYADSPAKLVVYGPAVNPSVRLAGNLYRVDVTVPDGGRLEIDPLRRTVTEVLPDGTKIDAFSKAHRGSGAGSGEYIFERVPVGTSEVSWDNGFGFDLTLYEEEGEPAWS